jgi:hypothetical protein
MKHEVYHFDELLVAVEPDTPFVYRNGVGGVYAQCRPSDTDNIPSYYPVCQSLFKHETGPKFESKALRVVMYGKPSRAFV